MTEQVPQFDFKAANFKTSAGIKQARFFIDSQITTLKSGVVALDGCFGQSIQAGKIIEWGLPEGRHGRSIPLLFLRGDIPPSIWIYADNGADIYAPAWSSHGVDLERLFFIKADQPVKQLRPLFLDNIFKIIIIDSPKKLLKGDLAFIHHQARENRQIIFLIRNHFLSAKNGNPLASVRLNCWLNSKGKYSINIIKGKNVGKKDIDIK